MPPGNDEPEFSDGAVATRSVDENVSSSTNVGDPLAVDEDDDVTLTCGFTT